MTAIDIASDYALCEIRAGRNVTPEQLTAKFGTTPTNAPRIVSGAWAIVERDAPKIVPEKSKRPVLAPGIVSKRIVYPATVAAGRKADDVDRFAASLPRSPDQK